MEKILNTSSGKYLIRPYQSGDESGVLSLWHKAFGKEMSKEIWRWKYLNNPFGKQIMLCVTEDDFPIVMFSGIPYLANCLSKMIRITHSMDNMSHPSYRGSISGKKGLFARTAEFFFEIFGGKHGSKLMYGFPGNRHFRLGKYILDYKQLYYKPAYYKLSTKLMTSKIKRFSGKLVTIEKVDKKIDILWQALKKYYPLSIYRDSHFVDWRFFKHPEKIYEVKIYKSFIKQKPLGYAVIDVQNKKAKLVDMVTFPEPKILDDLFVRMSKELVDRNVTELEIWLSGNHFIDHFLTNCGYKKSMEPIGFIPAVRFVNSNMPINWTMNSLFYTMADGDLL